VPAVLVTGGGTGIGAAVARLLRGSGNEVAILGRRRLLSDASSYVNGAVIPVDGAAVAMDVGTLPFDPRVQVRPDEAP
jgi:meso-butanediol dehydrogenase / (S,S)-butanediol dehydrogenase / diacetyl reductase